MVNWSPALYGTLVITVTPFLLISYVKSVVPSGLKLTTYEYADGNEAVFVVRPIDLFFVLVGTINVNITSVYFSVV